VESGAGEVHRITDPYEISRMPSGRLLGAQEDDYRFICEKLGKPAEGLPRALHYGRVFYREAYDSTSILPTTCQFNHVTLDHSGASSQVVFLSHNNELTRCAALF